MPDKENINFLVKKNKNYINLKDGLEYEELKTIEYSKAKHGLCKRMNRTVLKNLGEPKKLFICKKSPKQFIHKKPITVKFKADKKINAKSLSWKFELFDLEEIENGLNEGLDEEQLAIRVGSPEIAVKKLMYKIGGSNKNGIKHSKAKKGRRKTRKQ